MIESFWLECIKPWVQSLATTTIKVFGSFFVKDASAFKMKTICAIKNSYCLQMLNININSVFIMLIKSNNHKTNRNRKDSTPDML